MAQRAKKLYLTDGPVVRQFMATACRHTEGEFAGMPFVTEPEWQDPFLDEAFLIDPDTGLRVYEQVLWGGPKKLGKTSTAAALGLYGLTLDGVNGMPEPMSQVLIAAKSRKQAGLAGNMARAMANTSPVLPRRLHVRQHDILRRDGQGVMRWLGADAGTAQGVGPSFSITDELGIHPDERLYTTLLQSGVARRQPFHLAMTHVGWERYGVLGDLYDRAKSHPKLEVYGGKGSPANEPALMVVRDRENGFLFWWYGMGDRDDLEAENPVTWKKCNPASWQTPDKLRKLKARVQLNDYLRFNLNAWVLDIASFLPTGAWGSLSDPELVIPRGSTVWVGVDIATAYDCSAIVVNGAYMGNDNRVRHRVVAYIYQADEGKISMKRRVAMKLRELAKKYDIAEVHYDPWRFDDQAELLADDGLEMVEFPQNHSRMVPATNTLYEVVIDGRIKHDGDEELARHMGHAITVQVERGSRLDKRKSKEKIDAAVACAMAVDAAESAFTRGDHLDTGPSVVLVG